MEEKLRKRREPDKDKQEEACGACRRTEGDGSGGQATFLIGWTQRGLEDILSTAEEGGGGKW